MEKMDYIGLDVHKKKISYCAKDVSGQIQLCCPFCYLVNKVPSSPFGWRTILDCEEPGATYDKPLILEAINQEVSGRD